MVTLSIVIVLVAGVLGLINRAYDMLKEEYNVRVGGLFGNQSKLILPR